MDLSKTGWDRLRHPQGFSCTSHQAKYYLTCTAYDRLLGRAGHSCEICGMTRDEAIDARYSLGIDHDHAIGWFAVRGIACHRCNSGDFRLAAAGRLTSDRVKHYSTL